MQTGISSRTTDGFHLLCLSRGMGSDRVPFGVRALFRLDSMGTSHSRTIEGPLWYHPLLRYCGHALLACFHKHRNGVRHNTSGGDSASSFQLRWLLPHLHTDRSGPPSQCQYEEISFLKEFKGTRVMSLEPLNPCRQAGSSPFLKGYVLL